MNTIKNLQVNKKAKCFSKKAALKIAGLIAAGVILISIPVGVAAHNNHTEDQQKESIVAYYGEESIENEIVKFMDISEKLNKLDLVSFNINESLYKKHNISDQLKSPEEIDEYIEKFKGINSYISFKEINKQSENIDIVLNLVAQEKLVNSYLYNVGYSTAKKNITSATKKYAAEVFGVEDPANIYFNYFMDQKLGESNTNVVNKKISKSGLTEKETYNFDNILEKKEEININKGVISMTETDVLSDKISEDNNEYNADRNSRIREALANSVSLENQVEDYDLYNEKLANKMK